MVAEQFIEDEYAVLQRGADVLDDLLGIRAGSQLAAFHRPLYQWHDKGRSGAPRAWLSS